LTVVPHPVLIVLFIYNTHFIRISCETNSEYYR